MPDELTLTNWLTTIGRQPHGRGRRALRDDAGDATFAELVGAMERVATGLATRVRRRPCRVAIAMRPSVAYVAVLLGALRAGLVPAPLNTRLTPVETLRYLRSIDPSLLVVDEPHREWAGALALTDVETVLLPAAARAGSLDDRIRGVAEPDRGDIPPAPRESDEAVVFPTGGTTGSPKGALHTHRSLWLWLNTVALGNPRAPTDVELCFSPFFHITLGTNVLAPLQAGGQVWIRGRFDAGDALRAIDDGATRLMGAPTMFAAMRAHDHFGRTRRERVSAIRFGSAPSDPAFVRGLLEDYPNARIRAGFGATELGSVLGFDHEDLLAGRVGGAGRALPGVSVSVVDDDGEEVGADTVGHLVVSAPWQAAGYVNEPEQTAATFRPDGVHIGDLVRRSADGWITVVGRAKEMIISGGENVYPVEVEEALRRHELIRDAIVYGVPDEHWGERVEAALVVGRAPRPTLQGVRDHCRDLLAGYKIPKQICFLDAIPLTANNKPDRRRVRASAMDDPH